MKPLKKKLAWKFRKYSRWLRGYIRRVHITEKEIGGRIEAC